VGQVTRSAGLVHCSTPPRKKAGFQSPSGISASLRDAKRHKDNFRLICGGQHHDPSQRSDPVQLNRIAVWQCSAFGPARFGHFTCPARHGPRCREMILHTAVAPLRCD
jgi:hypothetical protein